MDRREQTIHDALYRIDPELAGMFAQGCALVDRIEERGVPYLVGHVGRELSKAALAIIARELPPVATDATPPATANDQGRFRLEIARAAGVENHDPRVDRILDILGEDQRDVIARALRIDGTHPLVRSWFRIQKDLVSITHYRGKDTPPPSPDKARRAFHDLIGLLFNRVGPYFDRQDDLDALVRVELPSAEDVARVRELLVRPQLRFRFFGGLANPGWLQPLRDAGMFDHPPEWVPVDGGAFRLVAWPEGECLVRFAAGYPELVADVMLRINRDIRNPVVWDAVARAVLALPVQFGRRLVPLLVHALKGAPRSFLSHTLIEAAIHLAQSGDECAFSLTKALIGLRGLPKDEGPEETKRLRFEAERMLQCLDRYELAELLGKVVPALVAIDPMKTWTLVLGRLRRALGLAAEAGFDDSRFSQHWCASLESGHRSDDVRGQLAVAATSIAKAIIAKEPSSARSLLELLSNAEAGLLARMRLAILTVAAGDLADEVDRTIADPDILEPSYGAVEVAQLLRTRFASAAPWARASFMEVLMSGPGEDELRATAEWHGHDPESSEARREALQHWQRKRLRWFHDRIPAELTELAQELGVAAERPSLEQQALDEVGFYSSGVYSRGETSPKNISDLRAMSHEELLAYLREWEPDPRSAEGPSRRGLADAIESLVAEEPGAKGPLLEKVASDDGLHPAYRRAALAGLRRAADQDRAVPWEAAINLVARTLESSESHPDPPQRNEWRWARQEATELIQEGCTKNRLPAELREQVFTVVDRAVTTSTDWAPDHTTEIRQFGEVVLESLNSEAGKTTYLMIEAALWNYRTLGPEASAQDAPRIRHWLELIRTRQDPGRIAARARLGQFLPQLLLLDQDWVLENAEDLLGSGMADPIGNPTWAAYLVLGGLYRDSFLTLRPWFGRHAAAIPELAATEAGAERPDRDWSVARHYLEHAGRGYLQGYLTFGEPDAALERVFAGSRADDRAHLCWLIFRGWSDATEAPTVAYIERLLRLWEWRLEALERGQSSYGVSEEADALGWFIITPHLPDDRVLSLAARTMRIGLARRQTRRMAWPRLAQLVVLDVAEVMGMTELLVTAELADQWPHFDFDEVAPVLRAGLAAPDAALRARAEWLVHQLGDKGWSEFGTLLKGPDGDAG